MEVSSAAKFVGSSGRWIVKKVLVVVLVAEGYVGDATGCNYRERRQDQSGLMVDVRVVRIGFSDLARDVLKAIDSRG